MLENGCIKLQAAGARFFSSSGSLQTGRSLTLLSNTTVEVTHGPGKLINASAAQFAYLRSL